MKQYLDLVSRILIEGDKTENRTGVDTYSVFGHQMRFNLSNGFPLVTTKKVHFKSIVHELLWFLSGDTNTAYLRDNGVTIWDEWADEYGDLGPVYGMQWRTWPAGGVYIDQIANAIETIQRRPNSRRIIVSAWNPVYLPDETKSPQENVGVGRMALAPCHAFMQFNTRGDYLDLQMYQRSVDVFLGLPFNIASYALLLHMVAQVTRMKPGDFVWTGGDCHLYENHIQQSTEIIKRKPFPLPMVMLNEKVKHIDDFTYEDVKLLNYEAHPHIKADIAV